MRYSTGQNTVRIGRGRQSIEIDARGHRNFSQKTRRRKTINRSIIPSADPQKERETEKGAEWGQDRQTETLWGGGVE